MKSTTGSKWAKFQVGLQWILKEAKNVETDTVCVQQIVGQGVNVTEVHPEGHSYLKGAFNALEAWRGWRDVDGWRLQKTMDILQNLKTWGASSLEY